jgi:hypothetical protein
MRGHAARFAAAVLTLAASASVGIGGSAGAQVSTQWPQHSMDRPQPTVVDPGQYPYKNSINVPTGSVTLYDGSGLEGWRSVNGGPAKWNITHGNLEVVPKTGNIASVQTFGDVQLHVEWRTPMPAKGDGQERGNSGIFFMGLYELQVLDSFDNKTYPDGQAGAIYGQFPPLVNPARPPGEWQTYDVIFHRPHFDDAGKMVKPARFTVIYNGLLVQDNVELSGPTANGSRPPYAKHADSLPIVLQDHGNLVQYRNIWARRLE